MLSRKLLENVNSLSTNESEFVIIGMLLGRQLDRGKVAWPSRSGSFQEVQSVVDYAGMDGIVAREIGKRRLQRIPVNEAVTDLTPGDRDAWTPDLVSVPEEAWQTAVRRFKILKPLFEIGHTERTFAQVSKIAAALGKHPSTIYRWIEDYERAERLLVFLRKERSDRGKSRLPSKVNAAHRLLPSVLDRSTREFQPGGPRHRLESHYKSSRDNRSSTLTL
jgi:hypothetical protein